MSLNMISCHVTANGVMKISHFVKKNSIVTRNMANKLCLISIQVQTVLTRDLYDTCVKHNCSKTFEMIAIQIWLKH